MKTVAVVLAAGSGSRMKSDVKKQYMDLCGKQILYYSLKTFEESVIDDIVIVVSRGDIDFVQKEVVDKYRFQKVTAIVEGGLYRYHSVRCWDACKRHDQDSG